MPHKVRMDEYLEINRRNWDERAAIHTRDTMRSASEYLARASELSRSRPTRSLVPRDEAARHSGSPALRRPSI
jgi:hypothetical protein